MRLTPKQKEKEAAKRHRAMNLAMIRALTPLDTCCPHCDYDEAEGGLMNHCYACARKIISELWLVRENAARRIPK